MYIQTDSQTDLRRKRNHDKLPTGWGGGTRGEAASRLLFIHMPSLETKPSAGPRTGRFVVWAGGNFLVLVERAAAAFSVGWTGSLEWSSPT
jgi:hypothetical protein